MSSVSGKAVESKPNVLNDRSRIPDQLVLSLWLDLEKTKGKQASPQHTSAMPVYGLHSIVDAS